MTHVKKKKRKCCFIALIFFPRLTITLEFMRKYIFPFLFLNQFFFSSSFFYVFFSSSSSSSSHFDSLPQALNFPWFTFVRILAAGTQSLGTATSVDTPDCSGPSLVLRPPRERVQFPSALPSDSHRRSRRRNKARMRSRRREDREYS